MIFWRLTSLEKVFGPLKITLHVMLQKEEDAGPGVEDSLLPSPNLPQADGGWEQTGFEPETINKSDRQSSAQTAQPGSQDRYL
ncbi:hypothetical protein BgiBS90_037347, partial [Biomphalaria glabrata]